MFQISCMSLSLDTFFLEEINLDLTSKLHFVVFTMYDHFCSSLFKKIAHPLILQIHDVILFEIIEVTCGWRGSAL